MFEGSSKDMAAALLSRAEYREGGYGTYARDIFRAAADLLLEEAGLYTGYSAADQPMCHINNPICQPIDHIGAALPTDSEHRKNIPLATGVLDYFPAALVSIAELSKVGNDKHNPGEDLHWARGKSMDHADTILRHLTERGTMDTDGILHDAKVAWRALAMLQEELEKRGAPQPRGAR